LPLLLNRQRRIVTLGSVTYAGETFMPLPKPNEAIDIRIGLNSGKCKIMVNSGFDTTIVHIAIVYTIM